MIEWIETVFHDCFLLNVAAFLYCRGSLPSLNLLTIARYCAASCPVTHPKPVVVNANIADCFKFMLKPSTIHQKNHKHHPAHYLTHRPKSKPTINHTPPPPPPPLHPLHPSHPAPPLLLTNPRQQLPHNARVLPDPRPFAPPQQRNKLPFAIEIRGRDAGDEAGEDDFAAREIACIQNRSGEGEDLGCTGFGVGGQGGLGEGGEARLGGEHGGAEVEGCCVVEEESLRVF